MLLDYIQTGDTISVSYYGKDGKTHFENIKLDKSQMFNWKECSDNNPDKDKKYKSWNGKSV